MLGARYRRRQGPSEVQSLLYPRPFIYLSLPSPASSKFPESHRVLPATGLLLVPSPQPQVSSPPVAGSLPSGLYTEVTSSERPSLRTWYHPQLLTSLCTLLSYSFFLLSPSPKSNLLQTPGSNLWGAIRRGAFSNPAGCNQLPGDAVGGRFFPLSAGADREKRRKAWHFSSFWR